MFNKNKMTAYFSSSNSKCATTRKSTKRKRDNTNEPKHENGLNGIDELNDMNDKLEEERELLISLINDYDPQQRSQIIWNSDYRLCLSMLGKCDELETKRLNFICQLTGNDDDIRS